MKKCGVEKALAVVAYIERVSLHVADFGIKDASRVHCALTCRRVQISRTMSINMLWYETRAHCRRGGRLVAGISVDIYWECKEGIVLFLPRVEAKGWCLIVEGGESTSTSTEKLRDRWFHQIRMSEAHYLNLGTVVWSMEVCEQSVTRILGLSCPPGCSSWGTFFSIDMMASTSSWLTTADIMSHEPQ